MRAPRVSSPYNLISHHRVTPYPPMGNCFGSAAKASRELQPGCPVTEPGPFAPAASHPNIKEEPPASSSSSRPPSRHRSHSHRNGRSLQDPSRSRTKSAPQPPQTFKSSSHQDSRPRVRSVVQSTSSRSNSRLTGPGETNEGWPWISNDDVKRAHEVRSSFILP